MSSSISNVAQRSGVDGSIRPEGQTPSHNAGGRRGGALARAATGLAQTFLASNSRGQTTATSAEGAREHVTVGGMQRSSLDQVERALTNMEATLGARQQQGSESRVNNASGQTETAEPRLRYAEVLVLRDPDGGLAFGLRPAQPQSAPPQASSVTTEQQSNPDQLDSDLRV